MLLCFLPAPVEVEGQVQVQLNGVVNLALWCSISPARAINSNVCQLVAIDWDDLCELAIPTEGPSCDKKFISCRAIELLSIMSGKHDAQFDSLMVFKTNILRKELIPNVLSPPTTAFQKTKRYFCSIRWFEAFFKCHSAVEVRFNGQC